MSRWLPQVLKRIRALALRRAILLTHKAGREISGLGLSPEDVRDVLCALALADSAGRLRSIALGEWMYVFKPSLAGEAIYVKVVLRENCVVVSFHEDEDDEEVD